MLPIPEKITQSVIRNEFCFNHEGKLRLSSGLSRMMSAILPFYYQGKVDSAAKEVLSQLKHDYMHNNGSDLRLAKRVLELNPSKEIAAEINAYAYALSRKEGCPQDAVQFDVRIAPDLSQRLERLGLSAEQQKRYPELMKMIEVNELTDYMEGANWKIDHDNWAGPRLSFASDGLNEPVLFIDGAPKPWSQARTEIFGEEIDASTSWKLPSHRRLDSHGISSYSMSNWEHLTPSGKLREHDGNFYLDIMSTTEGLNHNWIRLVNSEGEVISAGLCGEIYSLAMMRNSVGKLNSPDHREFFKPDTHRTTRISISPETYESIKSNKIETDQKTHNLFFSLLTRNCSRYACEVAIESGLQLDNSEFASQLGLRKLLNRVNIRPPKLTLKIIQKITIIARMILGTGIAFIMGAWYQNPDVTDLERHYHQWSIKPRKPFRSISSFFDGTNSMMASSMKVGEWQEFVQDYRKARLAFVQTQKETLEKAGGHFNNPEYQKKWRELERQVAYEMPPELDSSHLFLNDSRDIPTQDLLARILRL